MNLPTKLIAGALVTASLGASIVGAQSISTTSTTNVKADRLKPFHLKFDPAKHAEEIKLIEAGDYAGWAALQKEQGHDKILEKITAENFSTLQEFEAAMKNKDFDKAKELGEKLGLPKPGDFKMRIKENRQDRKERRQERKDMMLDLSKLSDDAKAQLRAAHKAHDFEKVREILKANGIELPAPPAGEPAPEAVNQ